MDIMPFEFDTIHDQTIKAQFYKRQFKTKPIQSVCYDSRNKVFIVGFSHNEDSAKGTLVKMKDLTFRNDSVIAIQEDLAVWHCNDMAYDPEEHRIYIARGGDKLAVVNPDSLLVERFEPIVCNAWAIARYPNGDWFLHDGDRSFKCDHQFKYFNMFTAGDTKRIAEALNVPPANTMPYAKSESGYAGFWQGAEIIHGKPYILYTEWSEQQWVYRACSLVPCIEEDDKTIYRCETPYEVEGMCLKDGKIHFVFGNIHIGGSTWDMNEVKMKVVPGSVKSISIPANTNYAVDFSKYVPEGYELADAEVQFKKGSSYLKLPYSNDAGKTILKIRQITGNKIILRSNELIGSTSLKIIGFCKKVPE